MNRADFLAVQGDFFPVSELTIQQVRFQAQAGVLHFGSVLRPFLGRKLAKNGPRKNDLLRGSTADQSGLPDSGV